MTAPDSYLDPAAVADFVGRTRALADAWDPADGGGTEIGRTAFGTLPAALALQALCQEVARTCRDGLVDGRAAFRELAAGVAQWRDTYEATDLANRDLFTRPGDDR